MRDWSEVHGSSTLPENQDNRLPSPCVKFCHTLAHTIRCFQVGLHEQKTRDIHCISLSICPDSFMFGLHFISTQFHMSHSHHHSLATCLQARLRIYKSPCAPDLFHFLLSLRLLRGYINLLVHTHTLSLFLPPTSFTFSSTSSFISLGSHFQSELQKSPDISREES